MHPLQRNLAAQYSVSKESLAVPTPGPSLKIQQQLLITKCMRAKA
jgi:hypothetical protein